MRLPRTDAFCLMRNRIDTKRGFPLHTHYDYVEIFWVESGSGIHHLLKNQAETLESGKIWMVNQKDWHGMSVHPESSELVLSNLVFQLQTINYLKERYSSEIDLWPWGKSPKPKSYSLNAANLFWLKEQAKRLRQAPPQKIYLERFLIELICRLQESPWDFDEQIPSWLQDLSNQITNPENFCQGVEGLTRLSEKTYPHIARSIKHHFQITPSEFVNRARMQYAANQLAESETTVADIANRSGFKESSYFFRVFKSTYGISPSAYRQRHQYFQRYKE